MTSDLMHYGNYLTIVQPTYTTYVSKCSLFQLCANQIAQVEEPY